jgi:hypothetical protein
MSRVLRVPAALLTAVSSLGIAGSCGSDRDIAVSRTGDGADSSAGSADSSPDDSSANRTDSSVSPRDASGELCLDAAAQNDSVCDPSIGYRCQGTETRIERRRVCDGVADCPSGDDEPCTGPVPSCPERHPVVATWLGAFSVCEVLDLTSTDNDIGYYVTCDSGDQIPPSRVCNGAVDCPDGDDEQGCPIACARSCDVTGTRCTVDCDFFCADGTTIPQDAVCDGIATCPGGDDEHCVDQFRCFEDPEGLGIDFGRVCDTVTDCPMGEDERQCPPTDTFFICDDGNQILFPYFTGGCLKTFPLEPSCADGSAPYYPCPNPP